MRRLSGALALILALVFVFSACGNPSAPPGDNSEINSNPGGEVQNDMETTPSEETTADKISCTV